MAKTTRDQVISDARDAVIEVSGDSSPITYGGETGLAARIRELTATSGTIDITYNGEYNVKEYNSANVHISLPSGTTTITENGIHNVRSFIYADVNVPQAKLDYVATFKVENENYYFASCQQGGYITAPVDPTITSGSFNGWKIGSTAVSFPYEPSGDVEIVADINSPEPPVGDSFVIDCSTGTTDPGSGMWVGYLNPSVNLVIGDTWDWTFEDGATTHSGQCEVTDMSGGQVPGGVAYMNPETGFSIVDKWNPLTFEPNEYTNWMIASEVDYEITFTKVQS